MIVFTKHAQERVVERAFDGDEILAAVNRREAEIRRAGGVEVRVVVKTLRAEITLPDGSTGDRLVACIDPRNMKVKTVMLQRSWQIPFDSQEIPYL